MFYRLTKCLPVLLLMVLGCLPAMAQQKTVTGVVRSSETREPVAGVTVGIKGSDRNVITNENGEFSITVPSNESVIKFSSIGFVFQEFPVGEQTNLTVSLARDTRQMEDVVVVGYGTKKRANVLGSVGSLNPKEVEDLMQNKIINM